LVDDRIPRLFGADSLLKANPGKVSKKKHVLSYAIATPEFIYT
jgi:hypothetical protein